MGRWVSKDPVRFDGGVNLYVYSANDPLNRTDRTGRRSEEFGNFLQCAGALAFCRFGVCSTVGSPLGTGACAACIAAALAGPCSKPFGWPEPGPPPDPPAPCPPGTQHGGWLQEPCVEDVASCRGGDCACRMPTQPSENNNQEYGAP